MSDICRGLKKLFQAVGMINNIGYPDFINNDTALDEYYEKVGFVTCSARSLLVTEECSWISVRKITR